MTEQRAKLITTGIYCVVLLVYVGVIVWVAVPGVRYRMQRGIQWAAYYRWQARWASLPTWTQEALIVRGLGPVDA